MLRDFIFKNASPEGAKHNIKIEIAFCSIHCGVFIAEYSLLEVEMEEIRQNREKYWEKQKAKLSEKTLAIANKIKDAHESMTKAIVELVLSEEVQNRLEEYADTHIALGNHHSIKELCHGLHPHTVMHGNLDKYGEHSMYFHNCVGVFTTVLEEVNYRVNEIYTYSFDGNVPYALIVTEVSKYYPDSGNVSIIFKVTRSDKTPRRTITFKTQYQEHQEKNN